jgi:hypothetical protein
LRVDHIHHLGPFITRIDFHLPDGTPRVWTSRRHRWLGGVLHPLETHTTEEVKAVRWWLEVGLLSRIGWWIAALFMVGATCFAVASAAGLSPALFGVFARNPRVINGVFFTGSIFFTSAAWLQFLAAVNADRIAAIAHGVPANYKMRWFAWRPHQIGWLSTFVQLIGTLLFNVNTFDALVPGLDWLQKDLLIWTPDVIGSICFLVASGLALIEFAHAEYIWNPADVSWWIVVTNLMGSVAFGISAAYAVVLPKTGQLPDALAANVFTCLGAVCFFAGAFLLLPELGRNVRLVVKSENAT